MDRGEDPGKFLGEGRLKRRQVFSGSFRKRGKAAVGTGGPRTQGVSSFTGKLMGIIGQEMIVYDVCQRPGIETVVRPEKDLCLTGDFMGVCKGIDGSVQQNAFLNGFRVVQLLFPFHEITDQVAYRYFRYAERQVCMR